MKPGLRLQYAIVTVAALLVCQSFMMIPIYRSRLIEYLAVSNAIFGLVLSLRWTAGVISVLPAGALVDRFGPRRIIRIGLLGAGISMLMIALSSTYLFILLPAVFFYGMFLLPLGIAVNNYLIRLFPNNRRRAISLNFAGSSVGVLFFPALAEYMLSLSTECAAVSFAMIYHGPFLATGLVALILSALYRKRASLRLKTNASSQEPFSFKHLLVQRRVHPIILLTAAHGTTDTLIFMWMSRFLESNSFASMPIGPGYVLSAWSVSYLVSRTILGLIPDRFGRRALMILPGIMGGTVFICGILSRNYMLTAGGYVLGAFLWSAEFPVMLSRLADEEPERFGAAMSLNMFLVSILSTAAIPLFGKLVDLTPGESMWKLMLIPAAVFPCIGIGAFIWTCFQNPHHSKRR